MKEQFQAYLEKQGYSVTTFAGNPSTVYDYVKRVEKVCEWEHTTWAGLAQNIGYVVEQYDVSGTKADLGNKSHRAVINALKRFSEFLSQ